MKTVPAEFPNKGKYRAYSGSWAAAGWSDEPQYPGQMPLTYPEDWTLVDIALSRKPVTA